MHANIRRNPFRGCVFSLLAVPSGRIRHGSRTPFKLAPTFVPAVAARPLLDAQRSAVSGSRESAVAVAQLPDPMLVGGFADLPITGAERFSPRQDSQTQFMLGVKQVFPGGRQMRVARRALRQQQSAWAPSCGCRCAWRAGMPAWRGEPADDTEI
jgi:hypothetical protein